MHELLAPLYYAVDYDSTLSSEPASPEEEFCSRAWVAADAWALFSSVMRGVGRWFEWREPRADGGSHFVTTPTSTQDYGKDPLASHVHLNLASNDGHSSAGMQPYVAPIVDTCNKIQSVLLKSVDPLLWKSLQASGIEPQMYGM
jgi:TBC1 domain family member 5